MTAGCPSQAVLQQYLDDLLAPEAEAIVISHVEECGPCQQVMDSLSLAVLGASAILQRFQPFPCLTKIAEPVNAKAANQRLPARVDR